MKIIKNNQGGFTLPELLIVVSVSAVLIGLIVTFTVGYSRFAASLQLVSDAFVTRLNMSDYFREKLGASSGLISQNSIADMNVGAVDTATSPAYFWQIVHPIPGTISVGSGNAITPIFYFRKFSQNSSGALIMNGTNPYEDELIIYLDASDRTLNVRTLANLSAPGNKAKTTCPKALATTNCPADAKLIGDVTSVDVRYFSRTGILIDWTSIFDLNTGLYAGPDFPAVEVVELKVNSTVQAKYQSNTLNNSTIIRVALRNT